jgi:galactokinase
MFFDTMTKTIEYCPIPEGISVVVAHSGKARQLAGSKYNERREQCEEAAKVLGVRALRHATLHELEDEADLMGEEAYKRAHHVITENARCLAFAEALRSDDLNAVKALMHQGHVSMRDDFEASSPEQDAMVEACGANVACVGARMTGGGFGGACVALVRSDSLPQFIDEAGKAYNALTGLTGSFLVCEAADGAMRLS